MDQQTSLPQPARATSDPATPRSLPRLAFPAVSLLVFWILSFIVGGLNKPYFFGFIYGMASALVLTLLFLGWWWFNRSLRLWEKCAGFVLVLGEAFLVGRFSHRSVNFFSLWMTGLPLIASSIVVWFFLVKKGFFSFARIGFALVVTLVWSYFLLIRIDGADSRLTMKTHWRWTPTAEEQFLAQSLSNSSSPSQPSAIAPVAPVPSAMDWVAFRGADRDGVILGSTIGTNWSAFPPALIWKHSVGPAWSSVLVVSDRVYTQEQRGEQEAVVAYDAENGRQIWIHQDTARFEEAVSGPGPRATPSFSNGRVFTVGGTGLLNCLDAASGQLIWQHDIKQVSGASLPMWAFSSSPLIVNDRLIVYAGGDTGKAVLAYRAQTGELLWSAPAGQSSYSSPQCTTLAGVPQCLMFHDAALSSFDLATGKPLWQTGLAMKGAPRSCQPHLIQTNQLLVGALNGMGCSLIEVSHNGDSWTAVSKWDSKDLKPEFPDFVIYNGYAYGFDIGVFCCLNLADGKRAWKEGRYGRGQVMLLRDQALLLISSETGELVLLAADPGTHTELARFQALQGKTWNHPVVRGDRVYLRNDQQMACYSLSSKPSKLAAGF